MGCAAVEVAVISMVCSIRINVSSLLFLEAPICSNICTPTLADNQDFVETEEKKRRETGRISLLFKSARVGDVRFEQKSSKLIIPVRDLELWVSYLGFG
ncbi:uncharacterized protein LOC133732794 [Rosa rugosa]|uniref:uncharacterized protein LOC133732794 n=1 Tax=Rosa rugosa TaxID=74645 RepID=UPI002B409178|nr:uncharacterized protein LOC133732794 [Rosa rugosa]